MDKSVASTVHKKANGANNWLKFTNGSPPPSTNINKPAAQKQEKKKKLKL